MAHQLFLSHDSRDRERADILAQMIRRISLGQIEVWHSSDQSADGGLMPGHVWLDEIRKRLSGCRAVVALITPTSLARPWLLFESGFGAAQSACDVIPVCIGVDRMADIPFPLAMFQAYQLSDYASLKRFAEKLTSRFEVLFDEQMVEPVLLDALKRMAQSPDVPGERAETQRDLSLSEAVALLREHIDKRIISLMSDATTESKSSPKGYAVPVILIDKRKTKQYVEINADMTVSDVLDLIYFMLDGKVRPYRYLEEWILVETTTKVRMVVREIESRIPANVLFAPGTSWEVRMLNKPYCGSDSNQ